MLSMKHDETAMHLREVLPRLCRKIRPVSSGTEIDPGKTMVLETGTLSDTLFPELIVVAGSFEVDEISLEVNRAGRRIVLSSRDGDDRIDRTNVASFVGWGGGILRRVVFPSGSYMRLVARNVGDAPRSFCAGFLFYVSVVEERERFLDALDRHTRTDAWLDEIRDLEQDAQRLKDDADRICAERTDNGRALE